MSADDRPIYETPSILNDSPLEDEAQAHFHFDAFASTLARLIADKNTATPLTIGVSGAWGSGKTTLLKRVRLQLDQTLSLLKKTEPVHFDFLNPEENPEKQFRVCRTVWFNAWKYADEDALLVALVRVIVQAMTNNGNVRDYIKGKLLDPAYPRRDVVNTVLSWFKIKLPDGEIELSTGEPQPTVFAEKKALLDLFDEAFDQLMAVWVHDKPSAKEIDPKEGALVVFIDDLDRCLPDKTVQVLEAIKLFMDKRGCIFVLGADTEVVRQAVESHYHNAHITGLNADKYLEKIIQLRFELPPVADAAMQDFLTQQKVDGELLAEWRTLLAAAQVNPRRVKSVLNDIDLQWRMLVNSGQSRQALKPDFIRWSALWRVAPANFKNKLSELSEQEDPDLMMKFIRDALRWGGGEREEALLRTFQEYEQAERRLKQVLRKMGAFSPAFDAATLEAFLHLAAPPETTPQAEAKGELESIGRGTIQGESLSSRQQPAERERDETRKTWAGIDFVRVPAGKFLLGSKEDNSLAADDEKPQHTFDIAEPFWIGRYPITNAQFGEFIQATQYRTTAEEQGSGLAYDGKDWKDTKGANWQHPRGPKSDIKNKPDHPVVQISWLDAEAFCDWLNQAYGAELPSGLHFRLPTEAEWEKAARGEYGNEWPWGSQQPTEKLCNFNMNVKDTTPVGQYSPQGDSPYGACDMAGNVWEWTQTKSAKYPYDPKDGREEKDKTSTRVARGGSWDYSRDSARCASRYRYVPDLCNLGLGFRLALSPIQL